MAVTAIASALGAPGDLVDGFLPAHRRIRSGSGLMGAATRFMFQPGAPLGTFGSVGRPEIETIPAASLGQVFVERRSLIFILIWFGTN